MLRFWLDRGVDGFRLDVAHGLVKDEALRDNPAREELEAEVADFQRLEQRYTFDRDEVHETTAGGAGPSTPTRASALWWARS